MTQLEKFVQNVYSAIKQSLGTNTDPASTTTSGPNTVVSLLKGYLSGALTSSVKGKITKANASKTRPSNTTPYDALDVVAESTSAGTTWRFDNIVADTSTQAYITKLQLWSSDKTETGVYRVHFFTTSVTAINDASPYLQLYANAASYIGSITLSAMATKDATSSTASYSQADTARLAFVPSSTSIYAILETVGAFTPASGTQYTISVTATQA